MDVSGIKVTTERMWDTARVSIRAAVKRVVHPIRIHRVRDRLSRATKRRTESTSPSGRDTSRAWVYISA
jgi:hypothetical protein